MLTIDRVNTGGPAKPRLSVCIPTFNHAHFLTDAIESVLSQTYTDFELIVVDNFSTDGTRELVEGFASRDARVRYFCNECNVGPQENLNRCLQHASGEYVKLLCADDLLEVTCLEKSLIQFDSSPNIVLVSCARQLVDGRLNPIRIATYSNKNVTIDGLAMINYSLFNGNYIGEPSAVMFRRCDAVRGFNTGYRLLIDLEMWLHLLEKGSLSYIAEPLCRFRQHSGQETRGAIISLDFIDEEIELYQKYIGKEYIHASLINRLKWRFKLAWTIPAFCSQHLDTRALVNKVVAYQGHGQLYFIILARVLIIKVAGLLSGSR